MVLYLTIPPTFAADTACRGAAGDFLVRLEEAREDFHLAPAVRAFRFVLRERCNVCSFVCIILHFLTLSAPL